MLKCSVVIPTYNREHLLRLTLESLTQQTLPREYFEVIVADDGSSDGTAEMVAGFGDRLNVRYLFQEDLGFRAAQARNLGIEAAEADVTVFVDAGVIAHSGLLRSHVDSHARSAEQLAVVGYVYCLMLDADDAAADEMGGVLDLTDPDGTVKRLRELEKWPDVRQPFYDKYGDDFSGVAVPWVVYWTCNVSARTQQLREVGMFDPAFQGWGGEDLDLAYRLHRAGACFVHDPEAIAIHAPHEKAVKRETEGDNYAYIAGKYGTPIVGLLPGFATGEVNPLNINDIVAERGLPSCEEYERQVAVR